MQKDKRIVGTDRQLLERLSYDLSTLFNHYLHLTTELSQVKKRLEALEKKKKMIFCSEDFGLHWGIFNFPYLPEDKPKPVFRTDWYERSTNNKGEKYDGLT